MIVVFSFVLPHPIKEGCFAWDEEMIAENLNELITLIP